WMRDENFNSAEEQGKNADRSKPVSDAHEGRMPGSICGCRHRLPARQRGIDHILADDDITRGTSSAGRLIGTSTAPCSGDCVEYLWGARYPGPGGTSGSS